MEVLVRGVKVRQVRLELPGQFVILWGDRIWDITGGAGFVVVTRRDRGEIVIPVAVQAPPRSWAYPVAKRALDIVGALVLLVVTLPIMAIIAMAIAIDSPGPVLFKQRRVSRNGRCFRFYKFRTMYIDARERFPELYAYDYGDEQLKTMLFKLPNDPRCTRLGRWLRTTSLDELPNLFNVLLGDMSLVGPRPEIPEMIKYLRPEHLARFSVKAGVTGLAHASGRNLRPWIEMNDVDVDYVNRRSFLFDLRILGLTVVAVLTRRGAV